MTDHELAWTSNPDELASEAPRRSWLARVLGVDDGGGALSAALLVGGLAAASFIASMAYTWEKAVAVSGRSGSALQFGGRANPATLTYQVAPVSVGGLGTVYVLAMLGLLVILGGAIGWPSLAQRLRVIATGLGVGLLGVLVAMTVRLPVALLEQQNGGPVPTDAQIPLNTNHEVGLYFGYLAVVLGVAGVWLAGPSLRRQAAAPAIAVPAQAPPRAPAPSTQDAYTPPPYGYRPGTVNGLSVSPAEPIDLNVRPGDAWTR